MIDYSALRRWPDAEADNLFASDAADRLIVDTAASALRATIGRDVVVVGDVYGALTLAAADAVVRGAVGGAIRVHQDAVVAEQALAANAERLGLAGAYRSSALDADLVRGSTAVLLRLPKSLDALDEIARLVAAHADSSVTVIAGGMQKHMAVAMNEVFARWFERIDVGLARQKARVLTVTGPRAEAARAASTEWPRRQMHADIAPGLWVCAHGGAFAGAHIDIGTRFLIEHLDNAAPRATLAIDLACGTGALAATLALRRPHLRVIASDQSAVAAASARATANANNVADRIEVRRENAGEGIPDACADLVLLNPPFHNGAALDLRVGRMLVVAAARLLAPGGELWTVYNSHLDYKPALRADVGPTRQVGRNAKFTIAASTKR